MTLRYELWGLLSVTLLALTLSAIEPFDYLTWFLETAPVLIGLPALLLTFRSFPLTRTLYWLVFLHAVVLMLGAHYTYARVPLGFWLQDVFDLSRNHYDRLGHFMQGFMPAILAREILLRKGVVQNGKWLFFIVLCICLAFSAFYEMIEWWAALIGGVAAENFLGTQGDVWDTQWDMFLAAIGAVSAQLSLSGLHDRQLATLKTSFQPFP